MHERININHIMWRLIEIDNNSSKLSNNFACRAYMVRESVYVVCGICGYDYDGMRDHVQKKNMVRRHTFLLQSTQMDLQEQEDVLFFFLILFSFCEVLTKLGI